MRRISTSRVLQLFSISSLRVNNRTFRILVDQFSTFVIPTLWRSLHTPNLPQFRGLGMSAVSQDEADRVLNLASREREPHACYPCRKRKVKCDGNHPCQTCQRRKHPQICTYDLRGHARRRSTSHRTITATRSASPNPPQSARNEAHENQPRPGESNGSYVYSGDNSVVSILRLRASDATDSVAHELGSVLGLQNTFNSYPFMDSQTPEARWKSLLGILPQRTEILKYALLLGQLCLCSLTSVLGSSTTTGSQHIRSILYWPIWIALNPICVRILVPMPRGNCAILRKSRIDGQRTSPSGMLVFFWRPSLRDVTTPTLNTHSVLSSPLILVRGFFNRPLIFANEGPSSSIVSRSPVGKFSLSPISGHHSSTPHSWEYSTEHGTIGCCLGVAWHHNPVGADYGTAHREKHRALARVCEREGQRALVCFREQVWTTKKINPIPLGRRLFGRIVFSVFATTVHPLFR